MLEHLFGIERGVVHHGAARLEHAEEGDGIVRGVGKIDSDVNSRPDAQLLQALGGAIGQIVELAIGELLAHEVERRLVRPLFRGLFENLRHRHGRELGIPAHARRVRLDPRMLIHQLFLPIRAG